MKKTILCLSGLVIILLINCSSPKYIYDSSSLQRQVELKNQRNSAVSGEIVAASLSAIFSAVSGTEIDYYPADINFRKIKVKNPTMDTLFVNMVTNVAWDSLGYCDFMDIRIPPGKNCRLICPLDADYNVYFRNQWENQQDEVITINTSEIKSLKLQPGNVKPNQPE